MLKTETVRRLDDEELAAVVEKLVLVPEPRRVRRKDRPNQPTFAMTVFDEALRRAGAENRYYFDLADLRRIVRFLRRNNARIFPIDASDDGAEVIVPASANPYSGTLEFPGGIAPSAFAPYAQNRPPVRVTHWQNASVVFAQRYCAIIGPNGFSPYSGFIPSRSNIGNLPVRTVDRAIFAGDFHGTANISHFTYDSLTRALVLASAAPGSPVLFNPPTPLGPYQKHAAELHGLDVIAFDVSNVRVKVKDLYFLDNICYGRLKHPSHFVHDEFLGKLKMPDASGKTKRKIYISRADSERRKMLNEPRLERTLQKDGFDIVVPTQHSPQEQLRLFSEAQVVVGPHGAGLTSLFASRPGTRVIEILHPSVGTAAYASIATARGHDYRYTVGTPAKKGEGLGFTVPIDKLMSTIVN